MCPILRAHPCLCQEICPKNGKTVLDFPKQTGRAMFFSKNIPCFYRKETIQWP
ncbi:hypothetical protein HMPREF1545_03009 [Oscillibacter sp. KLE 1728]|nr:hypothetical protein HMPREF1545_03009 [Oscillibacter sp. KLE 1728]ERK57716.1 hypothetical protein HMPREF1546_03910 [Oscillibacter sp. KLE 1745]